ncbi:hypothetical protein N2152v2_008324 [Parachlorella kessleri]
MDDKENSFVLREVDTNARQPLTATPSKGDPGRHKDAAGIEPAPLDSSYSSPASPAGTLEQEAAFFCEQHNPVYSLRGNESVAELAQQVKDLRQKLSELQPVMLTIHVAEPAMEAGSQCSIDSAATQRSEELQQEQSKIAGLLRGRVACLEGAVAAGESKIKTQLKELEALKSSNKYLEQQLRETQQQVGVTPERQRAVLREVQDKLERVETASSQQADHITRLRTVVHYDGSERQKLQEFTALEFELQTKEEVNLRQQAEELQAVGQQRAAELVEARHNLAQIETALQQREVKARQLEEQLAEAREALAAATSQAGELRHKAEQFDRDRQQAAANVRKAEREVDLIAQENASFFRQVNYVRTRLVAHLPQLESSVPEIAKLARELQTWCDKEAHQRSRATGLTPR